MSSSVIELVDRAARITPDAVALLSGTRGVSYRELIERSIAVAEGLAAHGVARGQLVGLSMTRSIEAVISLLGIMRAGAVYVPMDPQHPRERREHIQQDAGLSLVLEDDHRFGSERARGEVSFAPLRPDELAYVIYTSGSTGAPKGVLIEHRGLSNLIPAQIERFGVVPSTRMLFVAPLAVDASIPEVFTTLCAGATLVIAGADDLRPGPRLVELLRAQRIDMVTFTPSVLAILPSDSLPDLKTVISAGEACTAELVDRWAPGRRFLNAYGPTEITVCATIDECRAGEGRPSIGRPLPGVGVMLLPPDSEIGVYGVGVARGYLNRDELTRARFVEIDGRRVYRTGDLGRFRDDGRLDYLGRSDNQVKVRGFRVELEEVEALIKRAPNVRDAACKLIDDRLHAFIIWSDPMTADLTALKRHLTRTLPSPMLPHALTTLEAFPLASFGKLDRARLGAKEDGEAGKAKGDSRTSPSNERDEHAKRDSHLSPFSRGDSRASLLGEHAKGDSHLSPFSLSRLAEIWCRALGREEVALDADFVEEGGDSLALARMLFELQKVTGRAIAPSVVLDARTIRGLAAVLEEDRAQAFPDRLVFSRGERGPPLFFVHPVTGNALCFVDLARALGADRTVIGLSAPGLRGDRAPLKSVRELAAHHLAAIKDVQPHGPYFIFGWSAGTLIALEMAQELTRAGDEVALLGLIEVPPDLRERARTCSTIPLDQAKMPPVDVRLLKESATAFLLLRNLGRVRKTPVDVHYEAIDALDEPGRLAYVAPRLAKLGLTLTPEELRAALAVHMGVLIACQEYVPRPYGGRLLILDGLDPHPEYQRVPLPGDLAAGSSEVVAVPGGHYTIVADQNAPTLADAILARINR